MGIKISDTDLPGLYQSANTASIKEQSKYFNGILFYIILLTIAALFAFFSDSTPNAIAKIISAVLFLSSLGVMIWLRVAKPDDIWYNGRAVAESVKTRAWRWMLRAEPYEDSEDIEVMRGKFVKDLKAILEQNQSLIGKLGISAIVEEPISKQMLNVRCQPINERIEIYDVSNR